MSTRPQAEQQELAAGASAFLSKSALPEQVLAAVKSMLEGEWPT